MRELGRILIIQSYFYPMGTVLLVSGPTASGKSALGMALAQHLHTVILSADSRQVYRGMDIGTAKPSLEEQNLVPHYLIDIRDPHQSFDVGQFETEATDLLNDLLRTHPVVLVVGGTALYLKALRQGLDPFPTVPEAIQQRVRTIYAEQGIGALQAWLERVDPDYTREVDMANPHRLIRAIGVSEASGRPFSSFRQGRAVARPFKVIPVLLEPDREWLYRRINERVDSMLEAGLVEEARRLYPMRHLDALQTVGYQELFTWMEGACSSEDAVHQIKQNTPRFAKRQLTWFRKESDWHRFDPSTSVDLIDQVMRLLSAE